MKAKFIGGPFDGRWTQNPEVLARNIVTMDAPPDEDSCPRRVAYYRHTWTREDRSQVFFFAHSSLSGDEMNRSAATDPDITGAQP